MSPGYLRWLLLGFSGRVGVRYYWIGLALSLALRIAASAIDINLPSHAVAPGYALSILTLCIWALIEWSAFALIVKRLHDAGYPGLWGIAPVFIMLASHAVPSPARITVNALGGFFLIAIGMLPGARGQNRYGAGPLKP